MAIFKKRSAKVIEIKSNEKAQSHARIQKRVWLFYSIVIFIYYFMIKDCSFIIKSIYLCIVNN